MRRIRVFKFWTVSFQNSIFFTIIGLIVGFVVITLPFMIGVGALKFFDAPAWLWWVWVAMNAPVVLLWLLENVTNYLWLQECKRAWGE
jgi:hypothetical protein